MSTISTTCEGTINKDRTVDIVVTITPLMCVEVAAIVPPSHQALLRCAGSVGVDVYEEVVARGKASLYIEYTRPDGDVESDGATTIRIPTTLNITSSDRAMQQHIDDLETTAVICMTYNYLTIINSSAATTDTTRSSAALRNRPPELRRMKFILSREDVIGGDFTYVFRLTGVTSIEFCGEFGGTNLSVFMAFYNSLRTVNLSAFLNVTNTGHSFMTGCTSLSYIDLSGLSNVTVIGDSFLHSCASLTSVRCVTSPA